MGWQDTIQPVSSSPAIGSWQDTIKPIDNSSQGGLLSDLGKVGYSTFRNFRNAANFGFAPEIAGAAQAPLGALKAAGKYVGYSPDENDSDVAAYEKAKQADIEETKNATAKAPIAGLQGKLGGFLAGSLASGPASLGNFAAQGAATGLGEGEQKGSLANVAKDVTAGGLSGAAGYGGGEVIGQELPGIAKKAATVFGDVPQWVVDRYLANPAAINAAKSQTQNADTLASKLGEVVNEGRGLSKGMLNSLSDERFPEGMSVQDALDSLGKVNTPQAKAMASQLSEDAATRSRNIVPDTTANNLSDQEIYNLKKVLSDAGDYKSALPSSESAIANQEAGHVSNILKQLNPDYASSVSDVADNINLKKDLASKFGLKRSFGDQGPFEATDRTVPALKDLGKANKRDRAGIIEELNNQGYDDLSTDIKNTIAKDYLNSGYTNGSRKTVLGTVLGGAMGHGAEALGVPGGAYIGSGLGAMTGASLDKFGGNAAKAYLDKGVQLKGLLNNPDVANALQSAPAAVTKGLLQKYLSGQQNQ